MHSQKSEPSSCVRKLCFLKYKMAQNSLCYLVVIVVAFALVIFGLIELMSKKRAGEADADVQFRQLRAFGWLIVAQIVLAVGASLCFAYGGGMGISSLLERGVRAGSLR